MIFWRRSTEYAFILLCSIFLLDCTLLNQESLYVARATARPSFVKAHADQMAHFAAAD
jgi:hypothetical protein